MASRSPKTLPTAGSVAEFLAAVPDAMRRADGLAVPQHLIDAAVAAMAPQRIHPPYKDSPP